MYHIVGVFIGEGPPVPIPNTEVKLTYADNTCLVTGREDRSTPTQERDCFGSLFSFYFTRIILYKTAGFCYSILLAYYVKDRGTQLGL